MPTNPIQDRSPRKRTLSTKAATNGDPNAERKRKKLEGAQKKTAKTTLTQKKPTTVVPKIKTTAGRAATVTKKAPQHSSIDVEDADKADRHTGTRATDGSDETDDEMYCEPASVAETIVIDDSETEENLEVPEESDEAELSMWHSSFF